MNDWQRRADDLEQHQPRIGRYPLPGLLRQVRRRADLSQKQLAGRAGVAQSTVGKVESGALVPSLATLQRLLAAAELQLVVVDAAGRVVTPMRECDETRNMAGQRFPSHVDTVLDPLPGEWWADEFGLARPPETFYRDRRHRDEMRALSRWEVRVKQLRSAPRPPTPCAAERRDAERRLMQSLRLRGLLVEKILTSDEVDPED